jgi:hypothetical protein
MPMADVMAPMSAMFAMAPGAPSHARPIPQYVDRGVVYSEVFLPVVFPYFYDTLYNLYLLVCSAAALVRSQSACWAAKSSSLCESVSLTCAGIQDQNRAACITTGLHRSSWMLYKILKALSGRPAERE